MQLAQRDEPVQEEHVQDEKMDQDAAKSRDSREFDKGRIAPDPGMQADAMPDPKKQEHGDAEYWLMQPVYSKEYTESVKPRHIPAEKVSQLKDRSLVLFSKNLKPCHKSPGRNLMLKNCKCH